MSKLVITGVIDGPLTGGLPKAIELVALDDIADLSSYGLGSANNGGGTNGQEFTFSAVSASQGQYLYVASESNGFTNFLGFAPDYTSGAATYQLGASSVGDGSALFVETETGNELIAIIEDNRNLDLSARYFSYV